MSWGTISAHLCRPVLYLKDFSEEDTRVARPAMLAHAASYKVAHLGHKAQVVES